MGTLPELLVTEIIPTCYIMAITGEANQMIKQMPTVTSMIIS